MHRRLLSHEESAFAEIIDSYSKLLWVVASGILCPDGSVEDVEECVSDTFLALWAHPEKYEPQRGSIKSYLCIMAKSQALNARRKLVRDNTISLEEHQGEPSYEDEDIIGKTDYSILYDAIRQLGEPTKEILIRRYFHGETPQQISSKKKLPKKEIENRLYRGKKALRTILSENREVL